MPSQTPYVFSLTVRVGDAGCGDGSLTFVLPIKDNTLNDLHIDWGDGTTQYYAEVPADGEGVPKTYLQAGEYTIKLNGSTYFEGPYDCCCTAGAIGFGFGWFWKDYAQKVISISGNVAALLGAHEPESNDFLFATMFAWCSNLESIPATLFGGIRAPAKNMFDYTFHQNSSLRSLPEGLFANIIGVPAEYMFLGTFNDCRALANIPENLFAGIQGAPAKCMFDTTFRFNTSLKSVPAGLFSGIEGEPAPDMFFGTFMYSGLESIPAGLFSRVEGSPAWGMFAHTFLGCNNLRGESATLINKEGKIIKLYDAFPATTSSAGCYGGWPTGIWQNLDDADKIPDAWK